MNDLPAIVHGLRHLEIVQCGIVRHIREGTGQFIQRDQWSLHLYHYHGKLDTGGKNYAFGPGWISIIPPGMSATWDFPPIATHHYLHFLTGPELRSSNPILLESRPNNDWILIALDKVIELHGRWPKAAGIRFHDLLWRMVLPSKSVKSKKPVTPSVLQIALSIIRNELDRGIRLGDLASRCGVSPGHLHRLFKTQLGISPQEYVQSQRLDLCRTLLVDSRQPIVSIAAQVGFEDLQAFNKFVRYRTGLSPRAFREKGIRATWR